MAAIEFTQTTLQIGVAVDAFQIRGVIDIEQGAVHGWLGRRKSAFDKELESFQQTL